MVGPNQIYELLLASNTGSTDNELRKHAGRLLAVEGVIPIPQGKNSSGVIRPMAGVASDLPWTTASAGRALARLRLSLEFVHLRPARGARFSVQVWASAHTWPVNLPHTYPQHRWRFVSWRLHGGLPGRPLSG